MTNLGMPLAKTSKGEGNVPKARTYPTKKYSSQGALNQEKKCATKERERYTTKSV